jgi:hypothetical protein
MTAAGRESARSAGTVRTAFADRIGAEASVSGQVIDDASPDSVVSGAQCAQARTQVSGREGALTGISQIDETTNQLTKTLARTMETLDFIPERFGSVYGTAVHTAFASSVRALNLPGIGSEGVEQSFDIAGFVTNYRAEGSIRTDVVLRGAGGDVLAIYDMKTGGAKLSQPRASELRARTDASSNTPVIELHFERGSSFKYEPLEKDEWFIGEAYSGTGRMRRTPRRYANG